MKNIKKVFALSALALAISGCGSNNATQDTTAATPAHLNQSRSTLNLKIEKYTLDNGLEVVLHQDKSDPIVAAAIVYHVGSNRELPGKTGFAHFFEHMLFQNSENLGPGKFIKNIGSFGGTLNGGTWQDGTIYYEVFPKDALEKVLWMESDRMGYFINTVNQMGLENEKQVVKNEKRQGVDNRPYGHTDYVTLKALYPEGHPYSWDVIGSLEDLQNATLQDVRDFYQKWYGVNNGTLVLAGDFDTEQAKAWIKKYFGEFKPRGDVTPLKPMPVSLATSKSLYHEDNFATLPELTLTFPTAINYSDDAYALSILSDLLSQGKDSALYQTVVEQDKLAPTVNTRANHAEIAGTFSIAVRAFNGVDLDSVKHSIDRALSNFAQNGFSDEQLARIKTSRETAYYNEINSVFNKAATLAQHNEFAGDPNLLLNEFERYRAVDREQLMAVFNKYIYGKNYVATSFVPKGQVELALNDAVKADVVEEKVVQGAEASMAAKAADKADPLPPVAQDPSSFDRAIAPAFGDKPVVTLPQVWQSQLSNGAKILGIEHNELPLVSFSIRVLGGHSLDPQNKSGVANLMTDIMMEGTKDKTPQQLEAALGALGAELEFTTADEFITLTGSTLAANFEQVMALAQEVLLNPRWDENEWEKVKKRNIALIQQIKANPNAIAANVYAKLLYDADSPMSKPSIGTVEEVQSITLEDVKAFYAKNIVANLTSVHVAGDVDEAQVVASLKPLSINLKKGVVKMPTAKPAKALSKPQLYFVDVPGAKQSVINIGSRAMKADSADYYPAVAVNYNLGGGMTGELFQTLRLAKGYTYGAYSYFGRANAGGVFTATSSVRSNVTLESLQTFREILTGYGEKFDEAALAQTKSVLQKSSARSFETTDALLRVLQNISSYGLSNNYVAKQQNQLESLTLEQAKSALNKYINPEAMVYLVIGDAKTQLPRLKALGLGEAILLDTDGNKLN